MVREELDTNENIVRAILNTHWDESQNRWSSELFKGENTSVSRLSILPMVKLLDIFENDIAIPPKSLIGAGEINISRMQFIAKNYQSKPTNLTVVADPIKGNIAHAEIPQNITRGLAFKIIEDLQIHGHIQQLTLKRFWLFTLYRVSKIYRKIKLLINNK